jgi:hypothetical protein
MIQIDWQPSIPKLRQFAWAGLVAGCILGFLVAHRTGAFRGGSWTPAICVWIVAVAIALMGISAPKVLHPLYIVLSCVGLVIGTVIGTMALLLIFFLMFTPMAVWFRMIGRDNLYLRQRSDGTMWVKIEGARSATSYYRQY